MRDGSFAVGTRVKLSAEGIDRWYGDYEFAKELGLLSQSKRRDKLFVDSNPKDGFGVIVERQEQSSERFVNRVLWDNGNYNTYYKGDLVVVEVN